ncbi:Gfa-like protein [hydrothermal vent metagenome]|uniref:Gfa-like protein n=1 Tax=hydrothermal vent metagenome TaxID=652676 RepID=A0A3B0XQB6_9ZZZZ
MTNTTKGNGSCLCGAVKITAANISSSIGACHCTMCQKWAGGPLMAVECGSDVTFEGKDNISVYNSSDWAERAFCNKCGSHLYYRLKEPDQYIMPVGLFDTDISFVFDHQVFIDSKPSFYCFSNKTKEMTGEEVFAQYAPPES